MTYKTFWQSLGHTCTLKRALCSSRFISATRYVLTTLDQLIAEDYVLIYLHGATTRGNMPSFAWLKVSSYSLNQVSKCSVVCERYLPVLVPFAIIQIVALKCTLFFIKKNISPCSFLGKPGNDKVR